MTPSHFFIYLKGNLLQISSSLDVILVFGFTKFGVLLFIWICMNGSCKVLAQFFCYFWCWFILLCMAGSRMGLAQIFCAFLIFIFSRRGSAQIFCDFFLFDSFCVYHVPFLLFWVKFYPICWQLILVGSLIWCCINAWLFVFNSCIFMWALVGA